MRFDSLGYLARKPSEALILRNESEISLGKLDPSRATSLAKSLHLCNSLGKVLVE
jgi:hypothetical protein